MLEEFYCVDVFISLIFLQLYLFTPSSNQNIYYCEVV